MRVRVRVRVKVRVTVTVRVRVRARVRVRVRVRLPAADVNAAERLREAEYRREVRVRVGGGKAVTSEGCVLGVAATAPRRRSRALGTRA